MLQKGKECAQDLVNTLQQDFLAWHQQQAAQQQQMGAIASMQQPIQGRNSSVLSRNSCLMKKIVVSAQFQTVTVSAVCQTPMVSIHQQIPQQEIMQQHPPQMNHQSTINANDQ
jgi:hypothetical protein